MRSPVFNAMVGFAVVLATPLLGSDRKQLEVRFAQVDAAVFEAGILGSICKDFAFDKAQADAALGAALQALRDVGMAKRSEKKLIASVRGSRKLRLPPEFMGTEAEKCNLVRAKRSQDPLFAKFLKES